MALRFALVSPADMACLGSQKLERLLGLPPAFSFQKARVLVLRVTIPMDFYTSPITAEIDGVDIRLKVARRREESARQHGGKGSRGAGVADVVPSAADLAQSFLETQPVAEKKELEEAIAAETQDLAASVAISESESDDGQTLGTGQPLSLPAFLTDFLHGIVDRMQVRVRHVTFHCDVEVSPLDQGAAPPEPVTFRLSLDSINVEGVTTAGEPDGGGPAFVHKVGKRHILLDNIRAALISEANVFSSLAPSPSMPSPVASRSPVATEAPAFPDPTGGLAGSVGSRSSAGSDNLAQDRYPLQDSEVALNIPYDLGEIAGNPEEGGRPTSSLSTPRASVYRDHSPPAMREHAQSAHVETAPAAWSAFEREAQSVPHLRPPDGISLLNVPSPDVSVHSGSEGSSCGNPAAEDLAQSHIYSHEEAESMYMSALSEAQSVRQRRDMPGPWSAHENPSDESLQRHPPLPQDGDAEVEGLAGNAFAESSRQHFISDSSGAAPCEATATDATNTAEQEPLIQEPELVQDEMPTPRGPTRLVKDILSLSSISIYLPSTAHRHVHVTAPDLRTSTPPNLPGAFSVHSAAAASVSFSPASEPSAEEEPADGAIEIMLKPIEIQFDASIAFLLAMVVGRLLEAARAGSGEAVDQPAPSSDSSVPDIRVNVEQLSILFLEKLAGVADTPRRMASEKRAADLRSDILLQANIVDINGSVSTSGSHTEATMGIERVRFGYANDDIISFDRSVQLFESVASTFPSAGRDISVKFTSGSDVSRVEINTLPLHVKLDLQRLDETFSWFGGLSSFLNMGSSVMSNPPKSGKHPARSAQKPRGVRFEAPIQPDDRTVAKENKTDLRINGLRLDVVGKDCSVVVNTSALKLVHREEGIGVHFSRIRLAGPYLRNSRAEASVLAEIVDTRLEYVSLPRARDLERLLDLVTPSRIKFDEDEDEIMVDTLLRQRRKGPVLSLAVGRVSVGVAELQQLNCVPGLTDELAKLGTVAKYLPEDDRPGLLTLCHVKEVGCAVDTGGRFGSVQASLADLEVAHITVPSLIGVSLGAVLVTRNKTEVLAETSPAPTAGGSETPPVLMMRMIDDIEPVLKVNLMGLSLEYRVTTMMDLLDLAEDATPQDFEASLAASVANLGDHAQAAIQRRPSEPLSPVPEAKATKPIKVSVTFRDCLAGLNPLGCPSKMTVVLTDAHLEVTPGAPDVITAVTTLRKASVLLIDDVAVLEPAGARSASTRRPASTQLAGLCARGYVNICQISSARATVQARKDADGETQLEVEVRDDLLVLETCADSTQTLIALANALSPPTPPSKENKYRTSVVPVDDLLASITADAFGQAEGVYDFDRDFAIAQELSGDAGSEDDFYAGSSDSPLHLDSQYYEGGAAKEAIFDATSQSLMAGETKTEDTSDGVLLSTVNFNPESSCEDLAIQDNYFEQKSMIRGTAHRWNSKHNTYDHSNDSKVLRSPLKVCVRDVHIIWHLFDGYDWVRTRDVIGKAVEDAQARAHERRARTDRRGGYEQDFKEEEAVIDDFLFNSIYIEIPTNRDPRELTQAINNVLHDATATESTASTTVASPSVRASGQRHARSKSLKLNRSRRHKITFELKGVNADVVMFPPDSGETLSSIDVRVRDLDIFDHVPQSTWKKFATYDLDAGEREVDASMIHLELLNTKPVPSTPASEIVMKLNVLPLRLHVDQDALDFITRFFEFKDDSVPVHRSPSDVPFIQRAEVGNIPVRLDFKPKRVDYAGLRSGRTTEFMNFMILEDARMTLRRVILYGVPGFDRLGKQLNDIWMDNVKRHQLGSVLAGLGPVRSLVNAGMGFRNLIDIPIREYRKDGRIVRSIAKGATAFAKTTGIEAVKLGAKLAIGTQSALQGAEGLLAPSRAGEGSSSSSSAAAGRWDADDESGDESGSDGGRKISLYADQPLGIIQGVRGAYASLARDLSVARDAIIAVPAEVMETQSAQGAARAVLRQAPTIILRPAIGATKAIGQTLLGATNSLDPQNLRRVEAVSVFPPFFFSSLF